MKSLRHVSLLALLGTATLLRATDTASFQQQLQADLRRDVERLHVAAAAQRAKNTKPANFYYPYLFSGLINLHAKTGEATLLTWAKEDILWIVRSSIDASGRAPPYFGSSFRFLPAFCDAYLYLKSHGALTAPEAAEVAAQITLCADARLDRAEFGAQNRGLIYGGELLFCAHAVPDAILAKRWQQQGEALVYDSLNGWSVEDASIYEPFWFNYVLTLSEIRGDLAERLKRITTKYYFDHTKELLLLNGLLPDWGDGDWTHSWMWNVANLVLAGSRYRNGAYLEAARRLYDANHAYYKDLPAEAVGALGLALRWLDPTVPLASLVQDKSAEVVDDLVSKKIVFRGAAGSYVLFNYRDQGPYGRFAVKDRRDKMPRWHEVVSTPVK